MNEFFGFEQMELQTLPSKIQKVTRDQVNQLARQILNPDQLTVVTAGDIKSLSQ
jgi:zinc protease